MSDAKDADVDRLTRDDLVRWLQSALRANEHDWTCDADRDKESALLQAIFDFALQSLSQEAVREAVLEEAARVCYPIIRREQGWEEDNHVALLVEAQNAIRALKREPNAATPGASDD